MVHVSASIFEVMADTVEGDADTIKPLPERLRVVVTVSMDLVNSGRIVDTNGLVKPVTTAPDSSLDFVLVQAVFVSVAV